MKFIRQYLACLRLAADRKKRANSYEIISYRKHREAALLGIARKAGC